MLLSRDEVAARVITNRLTTAKVGVVALGLPVTPEAVASGTAASLQKLLHVAIVGYATTGNHSGIVVKTDVESAVEWRNTPDLAGTIAVFVHDDVPKLHSLADLDPISEVDLATELLTMAAEEPGRPIPQQSFWKALRQECATFPLALIEDFVKAVHHERSNINAIPDNLWRLGLLRDQKLLQRNQDPIARLRRNRELQFEMGLLSEDSRKRLGSVFVQVSGEKREQMTKAYSLIQKFYRTHSKNALQNLEFSVVEELLQAGKPITPRRGRKTSGQGNGEDTSGDEGVSAGPLKGKKLTSAIAQCTVKPGEDGQTGLHQLGEAVRRRIQAPHEESAKTVSIDSGFNGQDVHVEVPPLELLAFMRRACSGTAWGGVIRTSRTILREAVWHSPVEDLLPYDPECQWPSRSQQLWSRKTDRLSGGDAGEVAGCQGSGWPFRR